MLYVILFMSIFIVGIGYLLNVQNAEYLLAGYNTMSREEREKFDIEGYIPFFRKFHIRLGLSILLLGGILCWMSETVAGVFLVVYPVAAYVYFLAATARFSGGAGKRSQRAGIVILVATLILVGYIFRVNMKDNPLLVEDDRIVIGGSYGETFPVSGIQRIELVNELPDIYMKSNGFGLGPFRKGAFRTRQGERIKLLLNTDEKPYILITGSNGQKWYYSSRKKHAAEIVGEIARVFPVTAAKDFKIEPLKDQ